MLGASVFLANDTANFGDFYIKFDIYDYSLYKKNPPKNRKWPKLAKF